MLVPAAVVCTCESYADVCGITSDVRQAAEHSYNLCKSTLCVHFVHLCHGCVYVMFLHVNVSTSVSK